ncbi:uncharacterized protein LOC106473610 isoform X2 [Limulus polyphemus]|uniref:Uncharacterized protein LOC106473610 isoform X2 n=1 Tax=Limulus polyphemus TaxID=6850 RepID=A0ABM1TPA9_LIMPO|nr:uncharacterized protein LOC106473610 isoform X2 [Limulus polyphemus]
MIFNVSAFDTAKDVFEDCDNEDVSQASNQFVACVNSNVFPLKQISLKSLKSIKNGDGYENLCGYLKSTIKCSQKFQEMNCLRESERSNLREYTNIMTTGLDYLCNNKEKNLRSFYEADGYECVERFRRNITSFQQCIQKTHAADVSNKLLSKHLCTYGKDVSHCIRRLTKDCRKARDVILGFVATIIEAGKCDKFSGNSSPSTNKLEVLLGATSLAVGLLLL